MRKDIKKLISLLLMALLIIGAFGGVSAAAEDNGTSGLVIEYFKNPDAGSKPMARMWFPDAAAGVDDDDLIETQIMELAKKGFGGVEVSMLADGVSYSNTEGKEYGWGTENWRKVLKKVLKAAAAVPEEVDGFDGRFQVDITIAAHWPPALNTLDPNDDAANKELSYSFTKIPKDASGDIELTLPTQKTSVGGGGFHGGGLTSHFLFTDTLVTAAVVKVKDVADDGNYTFDFRTLKVLGDNDVETFGGYEAGVPDRNTASQNGWDYENIIEFFGPEPDGVLPEGVKQDDERNRKRMADWQDEYTTSAVSLEVPFADNSDGDSIGAGDWVILSVFQRGTGQTISGVRIMHNSVFVTSYFNEAGTKAITDYWNDMLNADPELKKLMEENPAFIFEDSIEASSSASYWAAGLENDIEDVLGTGYAYTEVLPFVAAGTYLSSSFTGSSRSEFFEFSDDDGLAELIYEDYNSLMAANYRNYRISGVSNWAENTLGWGFRSQCYHLPGLDIGGAAMAVDVAEGDNMSKGDGVRFLSGAKNLSGKEYLTMEAMTGITVNLARMSDIRTEAGQNYSDGVNRVILHGTPYAKTFNGYNCGWPGYLPFGADSFGDAYTYRQAYWEDITTETGYMARTQAVLQKGKAKIDVAVLIDKEETFDFTGGNRYQDLLDAGYSYNLISEGVLAGTAGLAVEGGRLGADGPAFKALIVDEAYSDSITADNGVTLSEACVDTLLGYADDGLPIILCGEIGRVYGSDTDASNEVAAKVEALKNKPNVKLASDRDDALAALKDLGVDPYARYKVPQLETTLYTDPADGTHYYYMFNNAYPANSGMMGDSQGDHYKGEDKVIRNAQITLEGSGTPYLLNAATGEITQVGEYTRNGDDTVTLFLDELYGGDSVICAITEDTVHFPASDAYVQSVDKASNDYGIVRTGDGLALRSNTPGAYAVALSDDTIQEVAIAKELTVLDLGSEQWDLMIYSYGPKENGNDPSASDVTEVDFGKQPLGNWADITATQAQLDGLNVPNSWYVSGIGQYTLHFTPPNDWNENTGAYLDVTYGYDQIGLITVNETKFLPNNASDRVDIGEALIAGAENTITIKLSTTLHARAFLENGGYNDNDGATKPTADGLWEDGGPYDNGLTSVKLTPYTQVHIGDSTKPAATVIIFVAAAVTLFILLFLFLIIRRRNRNNSGD